VNFPSETIKAITEFLFIGSPIETLSIYDLVVIMGNHLIEPTINGLKEIWDRGHMSADVKIILSGNVGELNKDRPPEAEELLMCAVKAGLPASHFILEPNAGNAYENILFSRRKIEDLGGFSHFSSILCIGQAFLLRRAKMCAARCAYPDDKMTYYGIYDKGGRNIGPYTWWKGEAARKRVLEELGRIAKYTLKGDLSID